MTRRPGRSNNAAAWYRYRSAIHERKRARRFDDPLPFDDESRRDSRRDAKAFSAADEPRRDHERATFLYGKTRESCRTGQASRRALREPGAARIRELHAG